MALEPRLVTAKISALTVCSALLVAAKREEP